MAKKEIIELLGYRVVEGMTHTDGNFYTRIDCDGDGIEWYNDGDTDIWEERISSNNFELAEELEEAYQKSKQGYAHIFNKPKKIPIKKCGKKNKLKKVKRSR